jgi:hypothetical protein
MAKAVVIESLVADLADPIEPYRHPIHGHLGCPTASRAFEPAEGTPFDQEAVGPRMRLEWDRRRCKLLEQACPSSLGERAGDA